MDGKDRLGVPVIRNSCSALFKFDINANGINLPRTAVSIYATEESKTNLNECDWFFQPSGGVSPVVSIFK